MLRAALTPVMMLNALLVSCQVKHKHRTSKSGHFVTGMHSDVEGEIGIEMTMHTSSRCSLILYINAAKVHNSGATQFN